MGHGWREEAGRSGGSLPAGVIRGGFLGLKSGHPSPPLPSALRLEPWPAGGGHGHPGPVRGHWVGLSERQHVWSQHSHTSPPPPPAPFLHLSLPLAPGRLAANLHFNHFQGGGKENRRHLLKGWRCLLEWSCHTRGLWDHSQISAGKQQDCFLPGGPSTAQKQNSTESSNLLLRECFPSQGLLLFLKASVIFTIQTVCSRKPY